MNFQNENTKFTKEVIEIANYFKEIKTQEGIEIGDLQVQIRDSNFDVAVSFSNGFKLTLKDDNIDDFAKNHKTITEAIVGSKFEKI